MKKFEELGLRNKGMISVLEELNFEEPTEIQKEAIPLILEGNDVIGNAATGSGKTFAFAAGLIEKTVPGKGVQALILTPTRELADQIAKVIQTFAKNTKLKISEIYGGVSFENQIDKVRQSDVLIATPGRLLDHLERKTLKLNEINVLVLDEADRMVDMGFLPDVERIIGKCSTKRQTLLFSATTSQDVQYISKKYMNNPTQITVETYVDNSKLQQVYYDSPNSSKFSLLVHLLKKEKSGIVLVFCNTRRNVDMVSDNLKRYKIHAHAIHGGLEQKKRSRVIEKFHTNEAEILVCTDVAARGLDIKGVTHVYNYDIPQSSDEYIHRIGRTARAGEEGLAISIVSNRDYDNFRKVVEDDSLKINLKELPKMEKLSPRFDSGRRRSFGGRSGGRRDSGRGRPSFGGRGRFGNSGGRRDSGRGRPSSGGRDSGKRSFGGRDSGKRSFGGRDSGRSKPSFGGRNSGRGRPSFGGRNSGRGRPSSGGGRGGFGGRDSGKRSFGGRDSGKRSFGGRRDSGRRRHSQR